MCATTVDENNQMVSDHWGYCSPDCPQHPDKSIWYKDDQSLKMSLHYGYTELIMNMLNVYGYLIMVILILCLLLTFLLPATGKIVLYYEYNIFCFC